MSRTTTTTPDSCKEITDPKKRPIDPEEQKSIGRVDALFKTSAIKRLAQKLETNFELVQKAKQILSEIPKCEKRVEEFSNVMREIWPFLATGLREAMNSVDVIGIIVHYSNHDSATQRWASMKADPSLEPSLKKLESASKGSKKKKKESAFMRLFLCILIGYWGDKAELPKLDDAIGFRDAFGYRMSMIEYFRKKGKPPPRRRGNVFTTTTTPDSRNEITDPKKRSIDPEEQKSIDRVDALFKNIIPSPPPEPQNPIAVLRDSYTIKRLAQKLVINVELAQKTKQILSEIPKCEEGVKEFSNAMREIWPCLTTGLLGAMNSVDVIGIIVRYSNRDSATQRWASMKADPSFEPFLKKLESASKGSKKKKESASYFGNLRLFLCILIGYWGDKDELPKLDAAIGRPDGFKYRMTMLEYFRKEENKPRPIKRVDSFSYTIKDADDAKNMEMVQNWLVSKYRDDKKVDREALLEEIRSVLTSNMKISLVTKLYDGKSKAMVHVQVTDCEGVSISMSFSNGAKN